MGTLPGSDEGYCDRSHTNVARARASLKLRGCVQVSPSCRNIAAQVEKPTRERTSDAVNVLKWLPPLVAPTRHDHTLARFSNYPDLWGSCATDARETRSRAEGGAGPFEGACSGHR
jgi:hypothetical protein